VPTRSDAAAAQRALARAPQAAHVVLVRQAQQRQRGPHPHPRLRPHPHLR
jgi:hypothetical protein